MQQIQQKLLDEVFRNLSVLGFNYAIIDLDGNKYGDLEIVQKKKIKRQAIHKRGELLKIYHPYVTKLQPKEIAQIPSSFYPIESIRASLCAWATKKWGKDSYSSTVNTKNNTIEIVRFK